MADVASYEHLVHTKITMYNVLNVIVNRISTNSGISETQGGLFSALRFTAAKAISVDEPLGREYPQFVLRSIVDDGISQTEVRTRAAGRPSTKQLTRWMWRL